MAGWGQAEPARAMAPGTSEWGYASKPPMTQAQALNPGMNPMQAESSLFQMQRKQQQQIQADADRRAKALQNQMSPPQSAGVSQVAGGSTALGGNLQMPMLPQMQMQNLAASGSGGFQMPQAQSIPASPASGATNTAELYKPLLDLQGEAGQYRTDLKNNTGTIANQVAGATGDFLQGLYNGGDEDMARRGIGGSGIHMQQRQQSRDTAARAGARQLGDVQVQQQQLLGSAIQGALPITQAAPQLAQGEKSLNLSAQNSANQANQLNFQNQLATTNQAFNQYMALLSAQRTSPAYTGFAV